MNGSKELLQEVLAEMNRARELHDENYMGNLRQVAYDYSWTLDKAVDAGEAARKRMEDSEGPPCKSDVLMEEVGELMADLKNGFEAKHELIQVAAMCLAWLGIDPAEIVLEEE